MWEKWEKIIEYSALPKAITMMYYSELDNKIINQIIDYDSLKQNMFSLRLHFPVVSLYILNSDDPKVIIILALNLSESIIKKNFR